MRISGPVTVSALIVVGLVASGSAAHTAAHSGAPAAAEPRLADATAPRSTADDQIAGLVPAAPDTSRKLRAMSPPADDLPLFGGTLPLQELLLPGGAGAFGIPEIVLAAYRNAELALQSADPGCGLSWHLLAGIGKVESNHAANGRTDAKGTTIGVIYGPALDGTLPDNEVIKSTEGGYVRAVGPMQFLPGTWAKYASDAKGDGHPDPNNVFDAALSAGKYLCSGGPDLRDPQQELRAVLRYNNSAAYAAQVLSWSNTYKSGGMPTRVGIFPDLIPPGTMPEGAGSNMTENSTVTTTTTQPPAATTTTTPTPTPSPTQVMINIPGLPPIPCGIFCPPPHPTPCDPATVPAPRTKPGDAVIQEQRWAPGTLGKPVNPGAPVKPADDPKTGPNAQPPATQPPATQQPSAQPPATQPPGAQQPGTEPPATQPPGAQQPGAQPPGAQPPGAQQPDAQQPQQPAACTQPQGQQAPGQPNAQQPAAPAPASDQQPPRTPPKTPEPGPAAPVAPSGTAPPAAPPAPAITLPFNIVIPLPGAPRQR